jgi:hypothetical protein
LDLAASLHACTYARSQEYSQVAVSNKMCLRLRLWRRFKYKAKVYSLISEYSHALITYLEIYST